MKKITNYIKENKKTLILLSIPLTLFLLLSYAVFSNMIYDFDMWIHSFVLNIRSDSLTSILLFITDMASAKFLIILSVLLLIFYNKLIKNKRNQIDSLVIVLSPPKRR